MPTPGSPQAALSATQNGEHPSADLTRPEGGLWALYARSGGPAPDGYTPDVFPTVLSDAILAQLRALRAIAAARGGLVVAELVDYGPPGGPARGRLMAGALDGAYDRVAAWDLMRLTADRAGDAGDLLSGLADIGVGLTLVEGPGTPHRDGGHDVGRADLATLGARFTGRADYGRDPATLHRRRPFAR